ncbi:hypothetical protein DV738_g430, partial [Chaetothyriales sp. CBS 135597]
MSDPYAIVVGGGSGRLKLKGVKDGKIDKHGKKKKHKHKDKDRHEKEASAPAANQDETEDGSFQDNSVVLRSLDAGKGKAERRYEEQRRKRLEERLRKEGGAKTHKQRVEELNRYLSGLSEHHDMPKIGPG